MLLLGLMVFVGIFRSTWWEIAVVALGIALVSVLIAIVGQFGIGETIIRFLTQFLLALAIGYAARFVTWLVAGSRNAPGRTSRVEGFFGERRKR